MKKKEILQKIENYLIRFDEILYAYVFGSFLHKENYHDVDIAIFLHPDFDKNNFIEYPYGYESKIISDLTSLTKNKIDIVVMNNAALTIRQRIINKGILVFCKDEKSRIKYENSIRKLYIDANNIRKIKRKYLREKISNA